MNTNKNRKTIFLDIETNMAHDTIWCCVCRCEGEERVYLEAGDLQYYLAGNYVVGHNIIAFDARVLAEVWNVYIDADHLVDTLVLSRLTNTEEKSHSLAAWGERLGFPKGDFTDYDGGLCDEMLDYCKQDVLVLEKLYERLAKDSTKFSPRSIKLEHEVARIVCQQERNGFLLDTAKVTSIYEEVTSKMNKITDELQELFPPIITERISEKTGKKLKDNVEVFNVGSRQQVAKRLEGLGVKFTKKTDKGNPIVDEKVLKELNTPESLKVADYLLLQKRASQVESWLKFVDERDGRVHGRVITNGAVTGRMTHHSPNMAQIPAVGVPYGKECRSCWIVEEGNCLVGADASGLELRMLAHYMADPDYTDEILSGDIHTANQKAAGLETRNQAKTFIYAFLYGAGAAKIGSIVGGSYNEGDSLIRKFLSNTPALNELKTRITALSERGYLDGLDGRRLSVRSSHAALNTLLQGAGAIVMKQALVLLERNLKALKLPFKFVANVHDEWQIECPQWASVAVGMQAVIAIREAGEVLNLDCPLDGEYKIGTNWAETH